MIEKIKEGIFPIKIGQQRIGYGIRIIDQYELTEGTTIDKVVDFIVSEYQKEYKTLAVSVFLRGDIYIIVIECVLQLFPPFERMLEFVKVKENE